MWGNVCRDNFGYGRVPASSSAVEGEFNKLKNFVVKESLRADKFVEKHIDYLIGRILIVDAQTPSNTNATFPSNDASQNLPSENGSSGLNNNSAAVKDNVLYEARAVVPSQSSENESDISITDLIKPKNRPPNGFYSDSDSSELEPEIIASREVENWRGKNTNENKKRRTAKYLGERMDEVSDILSSRPNKRVPLLRNGNSIGLQPPIVEGRPVTVQNTCAFDALCQGVLIACTDFPSIEKFVAGRSDIPIFNLVTEVLKTGNYNIL